MGIEIVGSVGPLEGKHQHTAPMSEAILKKLEKEAVASVAVAEALQGHAVHAILARSGGGEGWSARSWSSRCSSTRPWRSAWTWPWPVGTAARKPRSSSPA